MGAIAVDPLMLAIEFGCCAHIQLIIVAFESYLGVNICYRQSETNPFKTPKSKYFSFQILIISPSIFSPRWRIPRVGR
jgi:hypothetical protein